MFKKAKIITFVVLQIMGGMIAFLEHKQCSEYPSGCFNHDLHTFFLCYSFEFIFSKTVQRVTQ